LVLTTESGDEVILNFASEAEARDAMALLENFRKH
jgi:hypothetical protein